MPPIIVVDTGYLLELFKVPGHSKKTSYEKIKMRFDNAYEESARLFVPAQCIYELANLVAHVSDGKARNHLGKKMDKALSPCFDDKNAHKPWIITPSPTESTLPDHWRNFIKEYLPDQIGLTDTGVITEARRLKEKYKKHGFPVYIWTTAQNLKAREPDHEPDPYIGENV